MAVILLLILLAGTALAEIEIVSGPGPNSTLVCNETWVAWENNSAPFYALLSKPMSFEVELNGSLVNITVDIYAVLVLEGSMPILPVVYFEPGENGTRGRPVVCRNPPAAAAEEVSETALVVVIYFTSSLAIISSLVALVTYALLKTLRTLPGLVIMNLFLAFLLGEIMLQIRVGMEYHGMRPLANYVLSQGLLSARFIWMSLTGYEMCRSLYRGVRMATQSQPYQKWVILTIYMLIGWSIPIALMIIMYTVEEKEESMKIRRLFGVVGYLTNHMIIAVTLAINICVVVFISVVIVNASRRQRRLSQSSYKKQNVNFVRLFLVLLTVLGLFWILFFILVSLPEAHTQRLGVIIVYVILTDTQPVFVCIAFVCTSKVYRMCLVRFHIRSEGNPKQSKRMGTLMSIQDSSEGNSRDLYRGKTVTSMLSKRSLSSFPQASPPPTQTIGGEVMETIGEESDKSGKVNGDTAPSGILSRGVAIPNGIETGSGPTSHITGEQNRPSEADCVAHNEAEEDCGASREATVSDVSTSMKDCDKQAENNSNSVNSCKSSPKRDESLL